MPTDAVGFFCCCCLDLCIYLWLLWVFVAVRGLSLVAAGRVCSLVAVCRLRNAVVSLAAQHGSRVHRFNSCGAWV